VKAEIHEQATKVELDILTVLQFDFEFEFPFPYVKAFFSRERSQLDSSDQF